MNPLINPNHYTVFPLSSSTVIVREGVTQLFLLNHTASLLWQQLAQGKTRLQISEQWREQFGISLNQAQNDIETAISAWQTQGLLGEPPHTLTAITANTTALDIPLPKLGLERVYRLGERVIKVCMGDSQLAQVIDAVFGYLSDSSPQAVDVVFHAWQHTNGYWLVQGDCVFVKHSSVDALINHLHYQLLQYGIASRSWLSVLHAGAVSRNGVCLVLAGCGGAGKSTLTAALLSQGFQYFCDDLVPLSADTMEIIPLPVPLTIKEPSWTLLQPYYPKLADLDSYCRNGKQVRYLAPPLTHCPPAHTVSYLLFPRIAEHCALHRLNAQACLQRLLAANMVLPQPFTANTIAQLLAWIETTPAYEISYADLNSAIDLIEQQLCKQ